MHESSQSIAHNLPICMSRNPLIAQRRIFTPRGIVEPFADGGMERGFRLLLGVLEIRNANIPYLYTTGCMEVRERML